jgi:hypothetical protein
VSKAALRPIVADQCVLEQSWGRDGQPLCSLRVCRWGWPHVTSHPLPSCVPSNSPYTPTPLGSLMQWLAGVMVGATHALCDRDLPQQATMSVKRAQVEEGPQLGGWGVPAA